MSTPTRKEIIMDAENVPTTTELPAVKLASEPVKKKFYRNPKVVGGIVAGFIAAGVAVAITGMRKSSEPDSGTDTIGEDDVVVETFDESSETPPLD